MRFLKCWKPIWNLPEQPDELTQELATGKAGPHSWYYVLTNVGLYYAVITEDP